MKPVPRTLLEHLEHLAPLEAEMVPLEWAYDGEDHNLAVFVDEGEDRRVLEDCLLDTVMDYDEAHGTLRCAWCGPSRSAARPG